MDKSSMRRVVEAQLLSYNSRDLESFCRCFHQEVETLSLLTGKKVQGIVSFRELYRVVFEKSPNLHCELKSRIVLESSVVDEELVSGHSSFSQGVHAVAIYAFRDGLIDRVWKGKLNFKQYAW